MYQSIINILRCLLYTSKLYNNCIYTGFQLYWVIIEGIKCYIVFNNYEDEYFING